VDWLHGGIGDDGRSIEAPPGGTLVTYQIARMHTEFEQIAINRMDIECIIIPSSHLLCELDRNSTYKKTAAFHSEEILRSERYYDFVVNPQEFAEMYPDMSATEILSMIEDRHLLQPCAGGSRTKCNCKEHFQYAICTHSNLVKMLWFPECQVPKEYSVALIPSRQNHHHGPGVFAAVSTHLSG
jgi:hypothetical protein